MFPFRFASKIFFGYLKPAFRVLNLTQNREFYWASLCYSPILNLTIVYL